MTSTKRTARLQGMLLAMHPDDAAVVVKAHAIWVEAITPNFPGGSFDQRGVQRAYRTLKSRFGDTGECWAIWKELAR